MDIKRNLLDAELIKSAALPAAAATAYTDAIEIGAGLPEQMQAEIAVPATPALVDAKTLTLAFQDSDDGVTFANIAELSTLVLTGAGGVGAAAASRRVYLPPSVRAYVRGAATVLTAGGDNTAVSFTFQLRF